MVILMMTFEVFMAVKFQVCTTQRHNPEDRVLNMLRVVQNTGRSATRKAYKF
jgi:hypothetical protein